MSLPSPWIEPAKPPFPTPMNFPFQFCVGSHSSMLMRESEVGLRTIFTEQCAAAMSDPRREVIPTS